MTSALGTKSGYSLISCINFDLVFYEFPNFKGEQYKSSGVTLFTAAASLFQTTESPKRHADNSHFIYLFLLNSSRHFPLPAVQQVDDSYDVMLGNQNAFQMDILDIVTP